MWDCEHCGCQAIAGTVEFCPQCLTPRNQDVAAEQADASPPDATASDSASPEGAGTPQPPDEEIGATDEGDWGKD